jgi:hypothetical protein
MDLSFDGLRREVVLLSGSRRPTFRALTYEIDERGASDATHNACLSSLIKLPAG